MAKFFTIVFIAACIYVGWQKFGAPKDPNAAPARTFPSMSGDKTPAANADNRVRSLTGEAPPP